MPLVLFDISDIQFLLNIWCAMRLINSKGKVQLLPACLGLAKPEVGQIREDAFSDTSLLWRLTKLIDKGYAVHLISKLLFLLDVSSIFVPDDI